MNGHSNAMAAERREYYRVDDELSLSLEMLKSNSLEQALEEYTPLLEREGLGKMLQKSAAIDLPSFATIKCKHPEIAAYMSELERRIQFLADMITQQGNLPMDPTHAVDISGGGMKFEHTQSCPIGSFVMLKMLLFPEGIRITALGEVVNSTEVTQGPQKRWETGVRFAKINDNDREQLLKHIHRLQMRQIRERNNAKDDGAE